MSSGGSLVLNLGVRFSGDGGLLPINLGVNWYDVPVEPVSELLRRDLGLLWGGAKGRRAVALVGWGYAPAVAQSAHAAWGAAPLADRAIGLQWGLSPLLKAQGVLNWAGAPASRALQIRFRWADIDRERSGLELRWLGTLSQATRSAKIQWAAGAPVGRGARMRWARGAVAHSSCLRLLWGYPGLARQHRHLPWGPARPIPWVVRPPVDPEPEPNPESPFPPGNLVALNLGCALIDVPGLAPLNMGVAACYVVRPQRRTYVVINSLSVVRLPDRAPIEVASVSIGSSIDAWGSSYDLELADGGQLALLKPTAAGPRQVEITLNGYTWTAIVESYATRREWSSSGVNLAGRSRTALLAAPYAPGRVKATTEDRSVAQLVDEELADTGFTAQYGTVDWLVPAGAWFYDGTAALDAISRLAEASGAVVQSHPADKALTVRARYPESPWHWRERSPDHVIQEDVVTNESLQMRSAPLYDAVVVTGELAGKGVTCKVRRSGEAGQLFAPQVSSPLINTAAAGAERGRNILSDRGEQASIDLVLPLFAAPLKPGEVGRVLPLDLVEVVGEGGTWHGLCTAVRTEARAGENALVIEQTITLERHYTDAD